MAQWSLRYAVLAFMAFVPLVFAASRRSAGFDTYWRMPLHVPAYQTHGGRTIVSFF